METDNFANWLQNELDKRGWNQAELARKSGAKTASISRVMTGTRNIGPDLAISIALALGLPADIVYEKAGLLPKNNKSHRIQDNIIAYKTQELSEAQADEVIQFIEFLQDRDDKAHRREFIERHTKETREGQNPPEVVNKK